MIVAGGNIEIRPRLVISLICIATVDSEVNHRKRAHNGSAIVARTLIIEATERSSATSGCFAERTGCASKTSLEACGCSAERTGCASKTSLEAWGCSAESCSWSNFTLMSLPQTPQNFALAGRAVWHWMQYSSGHESAVVVISCAFLRADVGIFGNCCVSSESSDSIAGIFGSS